MKVGPNKPLQGGYVEGMEFSESGSEQFDAVKTSAVTASKGFL